jgi:hypothetical protein
MTQKDIKVGQKYLHSRSPGLKFMGIRIPASPFGVGLYLPETHELCGTNEGFLAEAFLKDLIEANDDWTPRAFEKIL